MGMKCPKCGSKEVTIQGTGVTTVGPKGEFSPGIEYTTGAHCHDCGKTHPLPSNPFWQTVIEKIDHL